VPPLFKSVNFYYFITPRASRGWIEPANLGLCVEYSATVLPLLSQSLFGIFSLPEPVAVEFEPAKRFISGVIYHCATTFYVSHFFAIVSLPVTATTRFEPAKLRFMS
jgi:hypothetical protein